MREIPCPSVPTMSVWTVWAILIGLLSPLGDVAATDAALPAGEYCLVPQDYNAQCLQVSEDGGYPSKYYPLSPASQVRRFCGECHDSYNILTVNSGSSPYYVIPDVGSLKVLREGQWSQCNISDCDPLLLHSSDTQIYVLCRFASSDSQVITFTVNLTACPSVLPDKVMISVSEIISSINPKVGAFFVGDGDVHLCVAGGNTLIFYNFRTGLLSSQVSLCAFVGQVTPFRGVNGQDYILVECTNKSDSLTVTLSQAYNNKMSKFVNTSILGVHNLGKNAISPDGKFIVSWRDATCVFSQLEINSTTRSVTLNTGAIHSATFMTVQGSMVFVVAVNNPNRGLYWFDVSHPLTDDVPSLLNGSAVVCVSSQCSGIVPIGSDLVLAAIDEGAKIQSFSLFNRSHFRPVPIGPVVTRIAVSLVEESTPPGDVSLTPHQRLAIGVSVGFGAPLVIAVVIAIVCVWGCYKCSRKGKYSTGESRNAAEVRMSRLPANNEFPTEECGRPVPQLLEPSANGDVEDQPRAKASVLVCGINSRSSTSNGSMTNGEVPTRRQPLGADSPSH